MIVFGIHCNFFIFLPIRLKTCRSNNLLFLQGKMKKRKIGRVSEVLRAQARPIGMGWAICPSL